ncbi:hypothetical protein LSAT2_010152 [Lamellibrachia satsuma]|nr:hypothetical protein LSAT2_010152 [Lamellibrachia satsuma]
MSHTTRSVYYSVVFVVVTSHPRCLEQRTSDDDALFPSLQQTLTTQYPQHKMSSRSLKNALVAMLVRPHVFARGRRVMAFRVLWRVHGDELEAAWRDIVGFRRRSDDILRRHGASNVSFFVSAVTGVFTKGKGSIKYGEGPGAVYPAVSYWVVLSSMSDSDAAATEQNLFWLLGDANPLASVKHIVTVRADKSGNNVQSLETMAAPLFVTLKDHRDSFTQRKVEASARHLGLSDTVIAKLVVVDVVGCGRQLYEVVAGLHERKLQLELDISSPDDSVSLEFVPPTEALGTAESTAPTMSPPHTMYSF